MVVVIEVPTVIVEIIRKNGMVEKRDDRGDGILQPRQRDISIELVQTITVERNGKINLIILALKVLHSLHVARPRKIDVSVIFSPILVALCNLVLTSGDFYVSRKSALTI